MGRPTEDLVNEHKVIMRMLEIVRKASDRLEKGDEVSSELFVQATDFFKNFVDRCHHTKEEKHLFVELMAHGLSGEVGPIAVMMREHQDGREHVKKLDALSSSKLTPRSKKSLIETSRAYVDLLSKHIQKENNILFPMADQMLTPEDQDRLEREFEDVETKVMGPGMHEKYHGLIENWEKRYG